MEWKGNEREVAVRAGHAGLPGNLLLPDEPIGLVAFAHGSGSSRRSPRNRAVAAALAASGLAALLFDLLTEEEGRIDAVTREHRFDIRLLTDRLTGAVDWIGTEEDIRDLPVGLFGASTGAAAALGTAAARPERVRAVVSRGGRPDLADEALVRVRAPVLLVVGGEDEPVIGMNRDAAAKLPGEKKLEIIPGATHLFEEPGKLEAVARLASDWFRERLPATA